jgi:hypothetical protein
MIQQALQTLFTLLSQSVPFVFFNLPRRQTAFGPVEGTLLNRRQKPLSGGAQ